MAPSKTSEEVQWENRIAYQKSEHDRLVKSKESVQSEIEKKMADYNIFIAQRDAESKKIRNDVLSQHDQLLKEKAEFQEILKNFKKERADHLDQKKTMDNEGSKYEKQMNNIREFIIAVQRAMSLLDI